MNFTRRNKPTAVKRRTLSSPSPRPSPLGRGRTEARLWPFSKLLGWRNRLAFVGQHAVNFQKRSRNTLNGLRFSLSPRQRAGVRGKSASTIRRSLSLAALLLLLPLCGCFQTKDELTLEADGSG